MRHLAVKFLCLAWIVCGCVAVLAARAGILPTQPDAARVPGGFGAVIAAQATPSGSCVRDRPGHLRISCGARLVRLAPANVLVPVVARCRLSGR